MHGLTAVPSVHYFIQRYHYFGNLCSWKSNFSLFSAALQRYSCYLLLSCFEWVDLLSAASSDLEFQRHSFYPQDQGLPSLKSFDGFVLVLDPVCWFAIVRAIGWGAKATWRQPVTRICLSWWCRISSQHYFELCFLNFVSTYVQHCSLQLMCG